ncbi:MAG TPA: CapA family protein [Gemmatimonadales bacterium]|nr:CapA family protein [Gemmatimonadales bacterium]
MRPSRPRGAVLAPVLALVLVLAPGCAPAPAPAPPPPEPEPAPPVSQPPPPVARRDTAPPAAPSRPRARLPVRIAFVGDVNLGTSTLPDGVPPDSGRALFAAARPYLAGDLVVGNLEGVIADSGTSTKCRSDRPAVRRADGQRNRPMRRSRPDRPARRRVRPSERPTVGCYAFLTPTHLAARLAEAGFTHLNLANNHAHDYGLAGRRSTETVLDTLGIRHYGPLGHIAIDTVVRGDSATVVGLVGFATYPHSYDLLDVSRSVAVVDSVRRLVDLLIVTFHGGAEGAAATRVGPGPEFLGQEPRGDLRAWAHAVIDAGADAVVGHGPHVLRGIELRAGRPIAYSLGNFATYRGFSMQGPLALTGVLQLEFAPGGALTGARLVSMRQSPLHGPMPDPGGEAAALVAELSVQDFGAAAARVAHDGTIDSPDGSLPAANP